MYSTPVAASDLVTYLVLCTPMVPWLAGFNPKPKGLVASKPEGEGIAMGRGLLFLEPP